MSVTWRDCTDFPYRKAGPFWRWFLGLWGFVAITMPWAIYCKEEYLSDVRLARHEFQHVAQMRRDGMIVWWLTAAWYLARYGYWNSPYEVEARAVQNDADAIASEDMMRYGTGIVRVEASGRRTRISPHEVFNGDRR